MLHKCANTSCDSRFRRLSDGKLFQVESERFQIRSNATDHGHSARSVEHFWLCDQCATHLTLTFERGRGMTVVPIAARSRRPVSRVAVADARTASA
jgi:hypothetical protein